LSISRQLVIIIIITTLKLYFVNTYFSSEIFVLSKFCA